MRKIPVRLNISGAKSNSEIECGVSEKGGNGQENNVICQNRNQMMDMAYLPNLVDEKLKAHRSSLEKKSFYVQL